MKGIFIHIPKNAGSSIQQTLPKNCLVHKHAPASRVIRDYGEDFFLDRFSFAFVRNPWCRMVSLYFFTRKFWFQRTKREPRLLKRPMAEFFLANDFRGYVKWWLAQPHKVSVHMHVVNSEQVDWLTNEKGEMAVSFVGKFENLRKDFSNIKRVIGIKKELPHVNKTKHKRYAHYYDRPTRKLIRKAYARDIELFGYKF